jgi:N-acyl amino acid synthase of PEP-CTERM/exosortase system
MSLQSVVTATAVTAQQNLTPSCDQSADTLWYYFPQYFKAMLANTSLQKQAIYRLRHKVYCEELAFESARPDMLEQDGFDDRSLHACIKQAVSGQLAGTVRIITSAAEAEHLPIEKYFANRITESALAPHNFNREQICEVSRLAVPAEIRCRALGTREGVSPLENTCSKLVAISLYLISQLLCLRSGRIHAYVIVEPALARALRRVGIHFVQIGDAINYNGVRAPYYLDVRSTSTTLKPEYRQLRDMLEQHLFGTPVEQKMAM